MKSERDELAKEVMKATLGCPPGPNCLLGHGTLAGRCYALADAMLAEAAKGESTPPPGYGEHDLTVPFRVIEFIRKRAEEYHGCGHDVSCKRALRLLADDLESLKDSDLPDGEPPLDVRTFEWLACEFERGADFAPGSNNADRARWAARQVRHFAKGQEAESGE